MRWASSVVTRLLVCFALGGTALSAALSVLEYHRALAVVEVSTSQQMLMLCHNLREVLRHVLFVGPDDQPLRTTLEIFSQDPRIVGVRLLASDGRIVSGGAWPDSTANLASWVLTDGNAQQGHLDLARRTLLTAPLVDRNQNHTIQLIIDGPHIHNQMKAQALQQLWAVWLVLGLLALLALLMLRRWLIMPLTRIVHLTRTSAPAALFERTARDLHDEFGHLAASIATMLRALDTATLELQQREQALESLYQFAPAALISITPHGRIIEANVRAAQLFGVDTPAQLADRNVVDLIRSEDRSRFRQSIDRLELDRQHRCELRIFAAAQLRDVNVEFTASHDATGQIASIRLSMLDITESRRLVRQISEQRRLLDLVVNHMSEGILLVGADDRIITANQRLGQLLRLRAEDLPGHLYDVADFWTTLELLAPQSLTARLNRPLSELSAPIQEHFEARDGAYLFQLIPVCDEVGSPVAQLWVVQEVSAQVRNRRLLEQQADHLRALQRLVRRLQDARDIEQVLSFAMLELIEALGVESLGIALRSADAGRQRQLIWDTRGSWDCATGQQLTESVTARLMPAVLTEKASTLWTDLSNHDFASAFTAAGLESLAAAAMLHRDQTCGIVWIGRRGGKHIERHHMYLLETLTPALAIALDNAQLRERLRDHHLTDPVTNLPSRRILPATISRLVNRPGHPWSLLALDIDHFKRINDQVGHAAADELLRAVAAKLRDTLRLSDTIIRHEADRFVIVCPDLELHSAAKLATRLRAAIGQLHITIDDQKVPLSCSLGVAGSPQDHQGPRLTLDLAFDRLAAAKSAGRNRIDAGPAVAN
jgi:diguanylate cyclase (GGDEF)-like protein/PAS domain S-box-containing protein